MIVSHKHRFIYVKAHKVAGTSVEHALSQHLADGDLLALVPPYNPDVDELEYEWPKMKGYQALSQHSFAHVVRETAGEEVWEDYLKVVSVRNPWDALVSFFFWWRDVEKNRKMPQVFDGFIHWHLGSPHPPTNLPHWLLDGQLYADYYIRFENLDEDCRKLFERFGLPYEGLPRLKTKARVANPLHYSNFYDEETKEWVGRKYAKIIKHFGYKFERKKGRVGDG